MNENTEIWWKTVKWTKDSETLRNQHNSSQKIFYFPQNWCLFLLKFPWLSESLTNGSLSWKSSSSKLSQLKHFNLIHYRVDWIIPKKSNCAVALCIPGVEYMLKDVSICNCASVSNDQYVSNWVGIVLNISWKSLQNHSMSCNRFRISVFSKQKPVENWNQLRLFSKVMCKKVCTANVFAHHKQKTSNQDEKRRKRNTFTQTQCHSSK